MNVDTGIYRTLPAVDELARDPALGELVSDHGQTAVTNACRVVLSRLREEISAGGLGGGNLPLALSGVPEAIRNELRRSLGYSLRPVINATGVILHTNLGRAPLAEKALDHARETAGAYSNLAFQSGAVLSEVGTTNRTRISDYERAINERTKLLLRVHRSNFEITGFTEQPAIEELVALAGRHKLPLMEDLGSGALFDLRSVGINDEPGVLDSLRSAVHFVTYTVDNLLGGPQA